MKLLAGRLLLGLILAIGASAASAADRAIIILDASGSMWGQIDGKPKLEIARQTLRNVLQTVPADMELGLMAYGHREKGSCTDIQLVVPPKAGSAAEITAAADAMKFLGKTPLSAAVKQAAEDLKYTEDKATVILITDGLETCNADPCALGKELEQSGVDFTAHVVGFGLTAEEGKKVACLAENTGGKYIQAGDEKSLEDALKVVVAPAPQPAPAPEPAPAPQPAKVEKTLAPKALLKEGGKAPTLDVRYMISTVNADGEAGESVDTGYNDAKYEIPAGDYIVAAESGYAKAAPQKVTIDPTRVAEPVFILNAAQIILRARPVEGAEPDRNAQIIVDYPGDGESASNYGEAKMVVPAGETKVTVKLGAAEVSETLNLAAGDMIEKDIIVGVGVATMNAYYSQGGDKVDSGNLDWKIFKAKKKIDGTREQVAYDFGAGKKFSLPPGDYVVGVEMQAARAEAPFSIGVGDAKDIDVVLDAGVVAIEAPGAEKFEIYAAAKDIQGERKQLAYEYAEQMQTTLGAGDYVVVTRFKDDKPNSETPFTVKAGERTELKVP